MTTAILTDRVRTPEEIARTIVEGVDFGPKGRISAAQLARQIDKHVATVLRWRFRGVDGIILPMRRVGMTYYVEAAAWGEFIRKLNTPAGK
jgi:hypothetical protein